LKNDNYENGCVNIIIRAGIADGGELEFRPLGTAAWLFDKVKY
jgi:hypothetical protein